MITDGYAKFYADRLWSLLPAVYRSLDSSAPDAGPTPDDAGPLRELVNRIGAQAAVLRQSIDRLAENQSIELADDWAIPYLGDLVATRLVACLDAAAQRIDVARTISYRRRAGTPGLLEQLAADIASADARCVELFRRLGRTRHQFDPPLSYAIANPVSGPIGFTSSTLQVAEGLIGPCSGTPAGGFADLRNPYAASNTGSAFDEYACTADLRAPRETLGRANIRNLGVFLWWLQAFPISGSTPVASSTDPACFTFDPTGRDTQLFAPSQRAAASQAADQFWGENWASPQEWVLPVPIRQTLWNQLLRGNTPELLYGNAFWVGLLTGGSSAPVPVSTFTLHPERGRFSFPGGAPVGQITSSFSFGQLLPIGAGGFNTAGGPGMPPLLPLTLPPVAVTVTGGAVGPNPSLDSALTTLSASTADATLLFNDSLTYPGPTQPLTVPSGTTLALTARSGQRPVLRFTTSNPLNTSEFTIASDQKSTDSAETSLILQGFWLSGGDLVLTGTWENVHLRMLTLDPGTSNSLSIDGLTLIPTTLWIEGSITTLTIERSILGPVRIRKGGILTTLNALDSTIQALSGPSLDLPATSVSLTRSTILGPSTTHQLSASESILTDLATVENPQTGCVRFTAYASGSTLHQPFRSVQIAPGSTLFRTRNFNNANYLRLRDDADQFMLDPGTTTNCCSSGSAGDSILKGAENGSEMGVYCLAQLPLKRRGLALKFEEYAPIGQRPIWIDAS